MKPQTVREFLARMEKAALDTSAGGQLTTGQQRKFLGNMIDAWKVLGRIRMITDLDTPNYELNELDIADRQFYAPVAGTEPSSGELADFTITTRTLTCLPVTLPATINRQFLKRNIEKEDVEKVINAKLGQAFGGNALDLAINGDGTTSGFLALNKGWLQLALDDSTVNDVDTNASTDLAGVVFPALRDALPEKARFSEITKPAIICSITDRDRYLDQISDRTTPRGDAALIDGIAANFNGFEVVPFPYWPEGHFFMTPLDNLVMSFFVGMELFREYRPRKHQLEFTLDGDFDPNYEKGWMIAYGRQIA